MAKSASSKVIFVPMQLQGDVGASLSGGSNSLGALVQSEASGAGLVNSISEA